MGFSFTLINGNKEFDIAKSMPGLWETFGPYRVSPTYNELINGECKDFNGWVVPKSRVYEIYTGLCAIEALAPRNHDIYPEYDNYGVGAYWRLVELSDLQDIENEDPRFTLDKLNQDNEIRAKVYDAYNAFIGKQLGVTSRPSDGDGFLSVYFWDEVIALRRFLGELIEEWKKDGTTDLKFTGGF